MAFFSLKYLLKRKYVMYTLLIIIAALFHKSVLVVLLFYPFANTIRIGSRNKAIAFLIYTQMIGVCAYVLRGPIRKIMFFFYQSYEGSSFDDGDVSALNILLCIGTVALMIVYYDRLINDENGSKMNQLYYKMICMGLAFYMYGGWIPESSRIGYYLVIVLPVVLARVISAEHNTKYRRFLIYSCSVLLGFLFLYSLIFVYPDKGTGVGVALLPYHFAELDWIFM